jgi:hypothetical protein
MYFFDTRELNYRLAPWVACTCFVCGIEMDRPPPCLGRVTCYASCAIMTVHVHVHVCPCTRSSIHAMYLYSCVSGDGYVFVAMISGMTFFLCGCPGSKKSPLVDD